MRRVGGAVYPFVNKLEAADDRTLVVSWRQPYILANIASKRIVVPDVNPVWTAEAWDVRSG